MAPHVYCHRFVMPGVEREESVGSLQRIQPNENTRKRAEPAPLTPDPDIRITKSRDWDWAPGYSDLKCTVPEARCGKSTTRMTSQYFISMEETTIRMLMLLYKLTAPASSNHFANQMISQKNILK